MGSLDPRSRRAHSGLASRDSQRPLSRDFLKPKKRSHPKQPRTGLFLSAWKIGLMSTFLALPSRKAGSTQLRITPYETRATSEPKSAGRNA